MRRPWSARRPKSDTEQSDQHCLHRDQADLVHARCHAEQVPNAGADAGDQQRGADGIAPPGVFADPRDEAAEDDCTAEADGLEQDRKAVDGVRLGDGVKRLSGASWP